MTIRNISYLIFYSNYGVKKGRTDYFRILNQKILLIRRRHFVWIVSTFLQISFVIFQHPDP